MRSSRFFSLASKVTLSLVVVAILCLVVGVSLMMGQGEQKAYQTSMGKAQVQGIQVPFVKGPKGKDGKVHQVEAPPIVVGRSIGMTKEGIEAKKLADEGKGSPTTKPFAKKLGSGQLNLLPSLPSKSLGAPGGSSSNGGSNTGAKAPAAASSSSSNFPGVGYTGFIPPDGGVAAGPVNVVAVVNSTINVYDKNGNLLSSQSLFNLFSPTGTPASDGPFDPSVIYNPYVGRFFVLAVSENDGGARSNFLIAVSNGSDVASGWGVYALGNNIGGNWCDYPHLGFDAQAMYFSCNMFSFPSTSGSFQYAAVRIITTSQFTGGGCCAWQDFFDLREGFLNLFHSFTVRPANMNFAGAGDGDYWVNAHGGGGGDHVLRIWQLTNAQNCCNGVGATLNVNDDNVGNFGTPPSAAQPFGATSLDSGDTRILSLTWEAGHLSSTQTTNCTQGGSNDACAAFTELDVSGYPAISNVNDWVYGAAAGEDEYYPYVEQNINGDKVLVMTRSSTGIFAEADFFGIPRSSTCTLCAGGLQLLHAGQGTYVNIFNGRNRWGDYHGAGADPDGLGIWIEGEYATSSGFSWATEIGPTYNSYFPSPAFSSNPVAFGNQTVFTFSGVFNEFITNFGNATLDPGSVSLSGDTDFFIVFDGCSFTAVQPGNSCLVQLQYFPTFVGNGFATLNVPYNNGGLIAASVTGTGVQANTSTAVVSSANPSVHGQPVTFTATVSSATFGTASGTVTFRDCAGSICAFQTIGTATLSGGVASLTTSSLLTTTHSIEAIYNGDANFIGSAGFTGQTVNQDASALSVASSKNPSAVGTTVTFTILVSATAPGSGAPTGKVTIKDGATILATATLVAGKATFSTAKLALGSHSINVTYPGDGNFTASSGGLVQVVEGATTTTLASSVNPSVFGQAVKFTATVHHTTAGTPTGTITFKDGGIALGPAVAVSGGVATFSTSTLSAATHSITAGYSGDSHFLASTSAGLAQKVNKAVTKSTVASSVNPSVSGQAVTFTIKVAAVAPGSGTPAGTVTLKDGAATIGSKALSGGTAMITTSALGVGAHSITAVYSGNVSFATSTTPTLTQNVNKASTSTTLTSSPNPSNLGQTVTFTIKVTVNAPGSGTPTGTVTLKDGATPLGSAPLAGGKATLTTSLLAHGVHHMTGVYAGDSKDNGSTSPNHDQTVN
jgi:hypothetical protein